VPNPYFCLDNKLICMKKILLVACMAGALACNNATTGSTEQKQDTSASSSADSILKAVEKMKADSAAMRADSLGSRKDSLKK
jgi:hypothetical protein